ncbi:MAG: hypothetical protein HYY40_12625 [Bacteroidetes bacterium]|nr:hypothetical protein [Bacteroidota bacterium]
MKTIKRFFFIILFHFLIAGGALSQKPGTTGQTGIGLRIGDPAGFTAKRYINHEQAVQVNLGRSSWWWGGGYYRNHFNDIDELKNYSYEYSRILFAGSLQAHYLYHFDINTKKILKEMDVNEPEIEELKGRLQIYAGGGLQFRMVSVRYSYRYRQYYGPGNNDFNWFYEDGIYPDPDIGWDAVAGAEYRMEKFPFSVFCDGNMFIEIFNDFFYPRLQAGLGARYWF